MVDVLRNTHYDPMLRSTSRVNLYVTARKRLHIKKTSGITIVCKVQGTLFYVMMCACCKVHVASHKRTKLGPGCTVARHSEYYSCNWTMITRVHHDA